MTHSDRRIGANAIPCRIDHHIRFDSDVLSSYVSRRWEPVIYDTLLLAAAVEFCDRKRLRPPMDWPRDFTLSLPVHDPARWQAPIVYDALVTALSSLTGDRWSLKFRRIRKSFEGRRQERLLFPSDVDSVVPFSDGLDSLAVAAIMENDSPGEIIRVRVGSRPKRTQRRQRQPFAAIPFKVSMKSRGKQEASRRSRGFKFALVAGLAAYLVRAKSVIVPESGQGAIGPLLVNVGHAHPDRRTHPQFTKLMSVFLQKLLGYDVAFRHPTIWGTKAETLERYRQIHPKSTAWRGTRSCWQDARQATVAGTHRQCGVCAACLIRRVSLFAAGYEDPQDGYVWRNLRARSLWQGVDRRFHLRHGAQREYALAGVLHMDHLADFGNLPQSDAVVDRQALILSKSLDMTFDESRAGIERLVAKHRDEWHSFLASLPSTSFVRRWAESK